MKYEIINIKNYVSHIRMGKNHYSCNNEAVVTTLLQRGPVICNGAP